MRTFPVLATKGITSYHWTLSASWPDTVFTGKKTASVIPWGDDSASVHGFWVRLTVPRKAAGGWWRVKDL